MNDIKRLLIVAFMATGMNALADCGCEGTCGRDGDRNTGCCEDDHGCIGGKYITNKTTFSDYIGWMRSGTYMHEALTGLCRTWARQDGYGSFVMAAPFGGRSTGDGLRHWFGLNHRSELVVAEESAPAPIHANTLTTTDVALDARHFNIETTTGNFTSTIKFCPRQKFYGVGLDWKQIIWRNDNETGRVWFEVNAPVVHVENEMRFTEDTKGVTYTAVDANGLDGSPRVSSMIDAFSQSNWQYGRIFSCGTNNGCDSCCSVNTTNNTNNTTTGCRCGHDCDCDCGAEMEKTALAFLELKFGYNSVITECALLGSYLGVIFPTGKEGCPGMVFAPMIGGKHWGIMWGSDIAFTMWTNDEAKLRARLDIDGTYLFRHNEKRSFDLVGKPWSRYMEMYATQADAVTAAAGDGDPRSGTSGINLMTRCVDVTPGGQLNVNTGFIYEGKCFLAEVGHTWYGRQAEKISCPDWPTDTTKLPVLKSYLGRGIVAKARTIVDRFAPVDTLNSAALYNDVTTNGYDAYKITKCQVDWNSGSHDAVLAHSVYGTIGYNWGDACYPTLVTVGGAYDFAESNTSMRRWTLFGKLGVSF